MLTAEKFIPWLTVDTESNIASRQDIRILTEDLNRIGPLPRGCVPLGMASDQRPILFNLYNVINGMHPGAMLILGDPGCGKTRFLTTLLQSASLLNPGEISVNLISAEVHEADEFGLSSYRFESCRPYQIEAQDRILKLSAIARQRLDGRLPGPAILFAIDDLPALQPYLDHPVSDELNWLVQHGCAAHIWTFATLSSKTAEEGIIAPVLFKAFSTFLYGHIENSEWMSALTGEQTMEFSDLAAGIEFCFPRQKTWLRFKILGLEPANHSPLYTTWRSQ